MTTRATSRLDAERARRNLRPHKAAVVAMVLYNERYAAQGGGSMDFWDALTDGERRTCRDVLRRDRGVSPWLTWTFEHLVDGADVQPPLGPRNIFRRAASTAARS